MIAPRLAVGDEVLDRAPFTWHGASTSHSLDQSLVDLADQALADRRAARQVFAHQVKRLTVVEQLAHVVGVSTGDASPGPELFGLLDAELGSLDVGRVVRLEQQGALAHAPHPVFRQRRSL